MVRYTLGLPLLVGALVLALCPAASALNSLPPFWITDTETNSYCWTDWGGMTGQSSFVVGPDTTEGSGSATATVTIADPGAGLVTGVPIGSRDTYIDLGPGGTIHLDLTPDARGIYVYLKVVYHLDFMAAPVAGMDNATLLNSASTLIEDTSLDPEMPSGWMLGEYLWKVEPADVGLFQGVDITADPDFGSFVEHVCAHTHFVPEPGSLVALATGLTALAGLIRRRRA
jgi:hypothetical protein